MNVKRVTHVKIYVCQQKLERNKNFIKKSLHKIVFNNETILKIDGYLNKSLHMK